MRTDISERLRAKLSNLLQGDPVLSSIFPLLGDLQRAKFSRGLMLVKLASDNGIDSSVAEEAAVGLELVHMATLVHDDVIDNADLRRNKANIRSQKNDRAAILFGDYLFSSSIRQIQQTQPSQCASIFTEQVEDTCRGESIQDLMLTWEDSKPSLDLLIQAARGKTGALFAFCTQAPFAIAFEKFSHVLPTVKECGYLCGLGFQWADDLLDIVGDQNDLGKPAGNDLLKNTMTTPLFMLMQEKGMNWHQMREHYHQNTSELRSDFLDSEARVELEKKIETLHRELMEASDSLETQGICIKDSFASFWELYVTKRMTSFRDAIATT